MADFARHLGRQLSFLESSNGGFDKGHVEEALRIAVALRVIFHNTKLSTSLITHLNATPQLLSTAAPFADEDQHTPSLYLVELFANLPDTNTFECRAEPLLVTKFATRSLDFDTWWNKEVVIDFKDGGAPIYRKGLVLSAANKDGGAHVDAALEPRYQKAMEGAGISMEITFKGGIPPVSASFQNIHYASLRQISYEVLNSPELTALAGNWKPTNPS